ncbi:hypothetical protein CGH91_21210 [Vibrio parahaemolyticus]|nr:hypothetical protein CGK42_22075 [Vibrio parahaemolyticus]TOL79198.1 hypothetical protein CGH91_21210 [Vibrio parahaemolyticus]
MVLTKLFPEKSERDMRKCMHNHLYRLEKQRLVKRLNPKGTVNASFEPLFPFELQKSIDLEDVGEILSSIDSHRERLEKDKVLILKKQEILERLKLEHHSFNPQINSKLLALTSDLTEKSLELEIIGELLNESETQIIQELSPANKCCYEPLKV